MMPPGEEAEKMDLLSQTKVFILRKLGKVQKLCIGKTLKNVRK